MATTENTSTGNGSETDYNFTFEYLKESDIKASVNGVVTTAFTLPSATLLRFNTAPVNGALIRIYRDTATDTPYATFVSGSSIRAQDLNNNSTQMLFSAQERVNFSVGREGGTISTGNLNLENTNIVFDGSTKDSNKTTLTVTDPTASRSIKLPNQSGTVPVLAADSNTAITSTPEELNILDGVTASATELNIMDGVTASTAELNIMDGVTASTAELNIMDGVTASTGELNIIDGVTASTAELNLMDGVTASTAELNYVDGVTSNVQTQLDGKQPLDAELTELSTMGSNTAAALADLTQAEVQILDGATLSTSELNFVDGVTSGIQSQLDSKQPLDSELTELATMASTTASALADLTQAEVQTLDGVTASTAEINKLDGVTATTAELNYVDGVTSNVQTQLNAKQPLDAELTELATMASNTASALADLTNTEVQILDGATVSTTELNTLDGVNSSLSAADLNQLDSNSLTTSATWTSNTQFPSAANIDARITARIDPIGGFEAIADEVSFSATAPPEGTVVSIANANGLAVNSSGVGAGTRSGGGAVVINGFPSSFNSTSLDDGIGLLVIATSTAHTYDFHRVVAKNEDVRQLSSDINDFKARYRIGSSNPTTDNDAGDLFFNTGNNKMLVRNSGNSAWEEVQSVGNFFIVPSTDFPTWNGSLNDISLSANAPANAEQILLSLNGVVQQPVDGTARPSSGFSLNGSTIQLSAAPAAGTAAFAVILGSTVNIGTPSNDTITNAMVTSSAAIAGSKISPDFGSQNIVTTGKIGIGTTAPIFLTDIVSGTANTGSNVNNPSQLSVTGANKTLTGGGATVFINSNSDLAADTGGSIAFSGRNTTSSTNSIVHATIKGAKENATSTNANGYLAFAAHNHSAGALVERMRIDSNGRVKIGNDTNYSAATGSKLAVELMGTAGTILEIADQTAGFSTFESVKNAGGGATDYGGYILAGRRDADDDIKEYMRIDSSGNVGIGKSTNLFYRLTFQEGDGDDNRIGWVSTSGNRKSSIDCANTAAIRFNTGTSDTERMRIKSDGNVQITDGNLVVASGHGIDFSATAGTGTSELLDDYEEGTFTPTYIGSGAAGTVTYTSGQQQGFYVKIGKWVTVWVDMTITSASGQSGVAHVTMPFTSQTDLGAGNYWMGSFVPWEIDNNFTNSKLGTGWMSRGVDYFQMYAWTGSTNSGHAHWQLNTTGRISGTFTYVTDS